jgi:hypothetical protein
MYYFSAVRQMLNRELLSKVTKHQIDVNYVTNISSCGGDGARLVKVAL